MAFAQIATRDLQQSKHFDFPPDVEGTAPLPDGFPKVLNSEIAWTGTTFHESSEFIQVLGADDVLELEAALQHFKCKSTSGELCNTR